MHTENNTHPREFFEKMYLGKMNGRDRKAVVPAGQPLILEHPQARIARHGIILDRVAAGPQRFDNYPHEVTVLDSQLITAETDAVGTEICLFQLYGLGDHYYNDVGAKIPKEKAYNGFEHETHLFARSTYTPWRPEVTHVSLLTKSSSAYTTAKRTVLSLEGNQANQKRVATFISEAREYQMRQGGLEEPTMLFRMTGD